jgi:hypothetical protein
MKHLEIYLESLTLESLCNQSPADYPYEMILKAGISKRQIIDAMLTKQSRYLLNRY